MRGILAYMIAAAPHLAASLNTNYYITIAAVIPTLFIAIGVQDGAFGLIARASERTVKYFTPEYEKDDPHPGGRRFLPDPLQQAFSALWRIAVLTGIIIAIFLAGLGGEIAALAVLLSGKDNLVSRSFTFAAAVILVVVAVVQPLQAFITPFKKIRLAVFNRFAHTQTAEKPPNEIISEKTDSPQATMTAGQDSAVGPESGKTDAG
jgi:hypothetical protein